MKKVITLKSCVLLLTMLLGLGYAQAQTVTNPSDKLNYDSDKEALINEDAISYMKSHMDVFKDNNELPDENGNRSVGCFIPVDGSYTAVPRNDDGSYGPISLPFNFNLYGTDYSSIYINTNGNITFNGPVWTYSPYGFPYSVPMVAPFWGDVDTRNGGMIYYKISSTNIIVSWDHVGYYYYHANTPNTFQVILTNGSDNLIGMGNNVAFYYEDMQWTTGDASGGSGGFGGVPATVGINKGNNVDYVQIGRFNLNNSNYDGPGGANDGVHYLDYKCFTFNVSNAVNQPPSVSGVPVGNVLNMECGEVQTISLDFIGPEVGQTVTTVVNTGGLCDVTTTVVNGNVSTATVDIVASSCNSGSHVISFTATDNYSIPASTTVDITVNIDNCCIPATVLCPPDIYVANDAGQCSAVVYFEASGGGNPAPVVTYSPASGSVFPVGTTEVSVTAQNDCGIETCSFFVTVADQEAPTAIAQDIIVDLNDAGIAAFTADQINNGSFDNCGISDLSVYPSEFGCDNIGANTVTLTVTDNSGNQSAATATVTVEDNIAPVLTAISTPITLWPPNHKYETISMGQLFVSVSDNCGDLSMDDVYITSVSSDEAENAQGGGDGNTFDDIVINSNCNSVDLRKERLGSGNGRVYTIYMSVEDGNGNTGTTSCQVTVPHDNGGTAIDDGMAYEEVCGSKSTSLVSLIGKAELKNYPNPFSANTTIEFCLEESNYTKLIVYNSKGIKVATLFDGEARANKIYKIQFKPVELSSGMYFYQLQSGQKVNIMNKMILNR